MENATNLKRIWYVANALATLQTAIVTLAFYHGVPFLRYLQAEAQAIKVAAEPTAAQPPWWIYDSYALSYAFILYHRYFAPAPEKRGWGFDVHTLAVLFLELSEPAIATYYVWAGILYLNFLRKETSHLLQFSPIKCDWNPDHGVYEPEAMIPGKPLLKGVPTPAFQCDILDGTSHLGHAFRMGSANSDWLITAAHVIVSRPGYVKNLHIKRGDKVLPLGALAWKYLADDVVIVEFPPAFAPLDMKKGGIIALDGSGSATIVSNGSAGVGTVRVNPHREGYHCFDGSTVRGFSGAPLVINNRISSLHLGAVKSAGGQLAFSAQLADCLATNGIFAKQPSSDPTVEVESELPSEDVTDKLAHEISFNDRRVRKDERGFYRIELSGVDDLRRKKADQDDEDTRRAREEMESNLERVQRNFEDTFGEPLADKMSRKYRGRYMKKLPNKVRMNLEQLYDYEYESAEVITTEVIPTQISAPGVVSTVSYRRPEPSTSTKYHVSTQTTGTLTRPTCPYSHHPLECSECASVAAQKAWKRSLFGRMKEVVAPSHEPESMVYPDHPPEMMVRQPSFLENRRLATNPQYELQALIRQQKAAMDQSKAVLNQVMEINSLSKQQGERQGLQTGAKSKRTGAAALSSHQEGAAAPSLPGSLSANPGPSTSS